MNTKTMQGQISLKCLDQRIPAGLILDKKKILVGSHEHADFRIQDKSVSSYHAFILLQGNDGFLVKDLSSEIGIFVNGKRVEESFVSPGDVLTIGTLSFSIEMLETEEVPVFNPDENIAPAAERTSSIALPPKEGLVFIDGEYCDIQFDESNFRPLTQRPVVNFSGEYVELDQTIEALEISHNIKKKKLEVISYMNGMMMDISYIELKSGDYSLTPNRKSKFDILFHSVSKTKIFNIKDEELRFYAQEAISPSVPWDKVSLKETLFLTVGAEQISFRFVDSSTTWKGLPLFHRDREFFIQASKIFAVTFLPLLLLLLVTIPKNPVPQETVAVVYKLPETKPVVLVEEKPAPQTEVVVEVAQVAEPEKAQHKEIQQAPAKTQTLAASQKKKVVAKATAPDITTNQPPAPAKTPPIKTYSFNSSVVAMASIVGDAPKVNTAGSASKAAVKDNSFNAGSTKEGTTIAKADIGVSKFNGSSKSGSGSATYTSRGLATKASFDSSYLETKTVVLGSMDPELLRKILREYIPQFRHCYQQELIGNSDSIKGVIDLNFTISANGKVAKHNIRAKDVRFSRKGIGCMAQVLGIIDFPKPKGGGVVDVRQPLNFFAEAEKI